MYRSEYKELEFSQNRKALFSFDRGTEKFIRIQGPEGPVSLESFPESKIHGLEPVLKIQSKNGNEFFYTRIQISERELTRRLIWSNFRNQTGLGPENAILVAQIPSWWIRKPQYQVIDLQDVIKVEEKKKKAKEDLAHGIV